MKHPVGKLDIAKEIRGIWTGMKDDHDYNTTIFCKIDYMIFDWLKRDVKFMYFWSMIMQFLIGWSQMSNLYIYFKLD